MCFPNSPVTRPPTICLLTPLNQPSKTNRSPNGAKQKLLLDGIQKTRERRSAGPALFELRIAFDPTRSPSVESPRNRILDNRPSQHLISLGVRRGQTSHLRDGHAPKSRVPSGSSPLSVYLKSRSQFLPVLLIATTAAHLFAPKFTDSLDVLEKGVE
jgi:hypothetical protein